MGEPTTILKAYKTRLAPNNVQSSLLWRHVGASRFVYNWAMRLIESHYKETGEHLGWMSAKKEINDLKDKEAPWLRELSYSMLESACKDLGMAYNHFFRRLKEGKPFKEAGKPTPRSRRTHKSFTVRGSISVERKAIRLPKIGWIKLGEYRYLPENGVRICTATVSNRAGKWYVSVQVEEPHNVPDNGSTEVIGLDMGIHHSIVCSDGSVYEVPDELTRLEKKLRRLQRKMARQKKGGKNRKKTVRQIQRVHKRIADVRATAIHQYTREIVVDKHPAVVGIEDLNVSGMLKNQHLAKAIAARAFGEMRRQLEYKCAWYGVELVVVDRWYPSSKTCSVCGCIKDDIGLSEREYKCEHCGAVTDRDLNAARNIARMAAKHAVSACEVGEVAGLRADPVPLDAAGTVQAM